MYKRTDIKVWFACNNYCSFCVQWDKRTKFKPRTLKEIEEIIRKEYDKGARGVVFTGWEPTVHPDLVDAVKYASDYWYKEIQIQSNGTNFYKEDYTRSLIDAWVTEFSPSIHWFHAQTHDTQVATPWAWEKVVRWLIVLKKLNQRIIINSVITRDNYKEAPELAALLCKIWVQQFQFAFVHILWSAQKNKKSVVPRKSDVIPYIHRALDIAKKHNTHAFTEAIPFCFMQGYEYAVAESVMPESSINDAEYVIEDYADYRWSLWKVKGKKCRWCAKYDVCEWPWKEYPEMFWWDEFHPIVAR